MKKVVDVATGDSSTLIVLSPPIVQKVLVPTISEEM